jgi:hypothetical protein
MLNKVLEKPFILTELARNLPETFLSESSAGMIVNTYSQHIENANDTVF